MAGIPRLKKDTHKKNMLWACLHVREMFKKKNRTPPKHHTRGPTKSLQYHARARPVRCEDTILPVHFTYGIANKLFLNLVGFGYIC